MGTGSDFCGSIRLSIWRGSCVCGLLELYHQQISSLHTHGGARDFAFVYRIVAPILCDPIRCNNSSASAHRHPSLPLASPSIYYTWLLLSPIQPANIALSQSPPHAFDPSTTFTFCYRNTSFYSRTFRQCPMPPDSNRRSAKKYTTPISRTSSIARKCWRIGTPNYSTACPSHPKNAECLRYSRYMKKLMRYFFCSLMISSIKLEWNILYINFLKRSLQIKNVNTYNTFKIDSLLYFCIFNCYSFIFCDNSQ